LIVQKKESNRSQLMPPVNLSEWNGVRCLHLDSPWVQGTMLIKEPFKIELDYVQRMMAWLLFVPSPSVKDLQALQLGLGAAAITKSCYKTLGMKTAAIEINPAVIAMCRQWFKLPSDNKRLEVVLAEAGREIKQPRWLQSVDALAVDLYDNEAAAPVMDSPEFYSDCRAVLTDEGIMTVNLFGRNNSYKASLEKIQAAFGAGCVWAFQPTREGNTVVMAFRTAPKDDADVLEQRADSIEALWGLPAKKWLKMLKPMAV
jgi:spermidine synthase